MDSESECSICLEKLSDIAKLQCCDHLFHYMCLRQWGNRSLSCPICRNSSTNIIYGNEIIQMRKFKILKHRMIHYFYKQTLRFVILLELFRSRDKAEEEYQTYKQNNPIIINVDDEDSMNSNDDRWIDMTLLIHRLDEKIKFREDFGDEYLAESFECHFDCFEKKKRKFIKNYIVSLLNRYIEQNISETDELKRKIKFHLLYITTNIDILYSVFEEHNSEFLFDD